MASAPATNALRQPAQAGDDVSVDPPIVAASEPERSDRPTLRVIGRRRRWPVVIGAATCVVVLAAMLGAAVFHTQLAQRQLTIDDLGRRVQEERERFDALRLTRSELRSPDQLSSEAEGLGMVLAPQSDYLAVDAWAFARQLAAAGPVAEGVDRIIVDSGPLEQFRDVKAAGGQQ